MFVSHTRVGIAYFSVCISVVCTCAYTCFNGGRSWSLVNGVLENQAGAFLAAIVVATVTVTVTVMTERVTSHVQPANEVQQQTVTTQTAKSTNQRNDDGKSSHSVLDEMRGFIQMLSEHASDLGGLEHAVLIPSGHLISSWHPITHIFVEAVEDSVHRCGSSYRDYR